MPAPLFSGGILIVTAIFLFAAAIWSAWQDREQPEPTSDPIAEAWAIATSIFEKTEELDGSTASVIA